MRNDLWIFPYLRRFLLVPIGHSKGNEMLDHRRTAMVAIVDASEQNHRVLMSVRQKMQSVTSLNENNFIKGQSLLHTR